MKYLPILFFLALAPSSAFAESGYGFCFPTGLFDSQRCGNEANNIFVEDSPFSSLLSSVSNNCNLDFTTVSEQYPSQNYREITWDAPSGGGQLTCGYQLTDGSIYCPDGQNKPSLDDCSPVNPPSASISDQLMQNVDISTNIQNVLSIFLVIILIVANFIVYRLIKRSLNGV